MKPEINASDFKQTSETSASVSIFCVEPSNQDPLISGYFCDQDTLSFAPVVQGVPQAVCVCNVCALTYMYIHSRVE